ncbi:hypothetical protein [Mesorhizobium sanjuanii]|uniref:hypothetical protein n=1 Tax=Mesorhizobium sanjuanii TaxID=2037900 RepID=UPI0013FD26EF|nr:hypothetical protein [Mesorhizobium sanjuanii]
MDSLIVTIAVLMGFGFFMVVLGYAAFDESRRHRTPRRSAWIETDTKNDHD